MKGVVLAGGLGTRLLPMTRVINKHLLPVYDRPMIYYPLQQLAAAGIEEILVVTGGNHAGDFPKLLGAGGSRGLPHLRFAYQEGEEGIAAALALAEHFAAGEPIVVILGDNLFQDALAPLIKEFQRNPSGAMVLLRAVQNPQRFGVAIVDGDRVISILEKPSDPETNLAVTGCYMYDERVFDVIRGLTPSERGELEITDVNNQYIAWQELRHTELNGWWTDAGTRDSLHRASNLVAADRKNPILTGGPLMGKLGSTREN
jgi:glucose-1-phosphate thymidylyltransferase